MYTPDNMKVIVKNKFGNNSPEEYEDSCGCGSGCGCHDEEDYSGFDNKSGKEDETTVPDKKSGSQSQSSDIAGK